MAQTEEKDKPPTEEEEEEALARELVEAVAAAYFGACRKLARLVNRKSKR